MNWLDIMIIVILSWFALTSLMAGIIREALTLIGFVLGVYLAGFYYSAGAELLRPYISSLNVTRALSFLAILIGVWIVVSLLSFLLRELAKALFLGWLDKLGGLLLGLLKGLVVVETLLIVLAKFPFLGLDKAISKSAIASLALRHLPFLLALLPTEFHVLPEIH